MYSKINFIQAQSTNTSVLFNNVLDTNIDEIYCFLLPGVEFIDNSKIKDILEIFNKYKEINGIYTDHNLTQRGITNAIYFPSFKHSMCKRLTINTPLFCKGMTSVRFRDFKHLMYYDFLYRMCDNNLLWHFPHILFNVKMTIDQT